VGTGVSLGTAEGDSEGTAEGDGEGAGESVRNMKGSGSEGDGVGAGESEGAVERKLNSETSSTETTAETPRTSTVFLNSNANSVLLGGSVVTKFVSQKQVSPC
jgi:flagellar hook assembly protein FlgD